MIGAMTTTDPTPAAPPADDPRFCWQCDGAGYVAPANRINPRGGSPSLIKCGICNGTGGAPAEVPADLTERVAMAMWEERRRWSAAGDTPLIPWDKPGNGGEHIRTQLRAMARAAVGAMAAEARVVVAAESWHRTRQPDGRKDAKPYMAACDELTAAVAAYRSEGGR